MKKIIRYIDSVKKNFPKEKKKVYVSDLLSFSIIFIVANLVDIQKYELNKILAIFLLFIILFGVAYLSNKILKFILTSRDKEVGIGSFIISGLVIATVSTYLL